MPLLTVAVVITSWPHCGKLSYVFFILDHGVFLIARLSNATPTQWFSLQLETRYIIWVMLIIHLVVTMTNDVSTVGNITYV